MRQKLCYVDPIYFIQHRLHDKADDPNSAYFNLIPEDVKENFHSVKLSPEYPNYIATGEYNYYRYDVICSDKNKGSVIYQLSINFKIEEQNMLYDIIIPYSEESFDGDYIGRIWNIDIKTQKVQETFIFFDNLSDLESLIKNNMRNITYNMEK